MNVAPFAPCLEAGVRGLWLNLFDAIIRLVIPRIYILDDDLDFAKLLAANLDPAARLRGEVFDDPEKLFARCAEDLPDAIVTDLVMPGLSGIDVTRRLRGRDPHLPIFVVTAHAEMATAIEALKAGATDYLTKPVNIDEFNALLKRALDERPLREEATTLRQVRREEFSVRAILGEHPRIEEVRQFVRQIADIPRPTVLLLGESGTGKNLVARAIHYSSPDSEGRFVEINCSALPPQLIEAELFGHQKGAFTDARESKRGLVEVADGGTLFLDEIGDLSPELQAKLLNFFESRQFRRIGGTEEIEVALRLITATNRDLDEAVRAGRFRNDLYYRISVATHCLPSLRDVKEDIALLADHFLGVFNREFRKEVRSISPEAAQVLQEWNWPGNVRELRNVMEWAMIFAAGAVLQTTDLPEFGRLDVTTANTESDAAFEIPKGLTLAGAEKKYIGRTMDACDGAVEKAAEILGISRKNLWEKRKKHGLL